MILATLYWPLVAYSVSVIALVGIILLLSHLLGERHEDRATHEVYESGMIATGTSRLRFPSHFYMIAMFFVIFDLETAFVVAWAVSFKELGWAGYFAVLIFIVELAVLLFYIWRSGALDLGPDVKKILAAYHKLNKKNQA
ncbi:MAG: NADH-quinone oxidoreductase subunit A [Bacteroidales bacterium]